MAAIAELNGDTEEAIEHLTQLSKIMNDDLQATQAFTLAIQTFSEVDSRHCNSMRAAFIEVDITPQKHAYHLQGYSTIHPRTAKGIHRPLSAQVLLIEDTRGARILWVTADIFAFDPSMVAEVRRFALFWGIHPDGVILNASHTHYAPSTLKRISPILGKHNPQFMDHVVGNIISSLPILRQRLSPVSFEVGATDVFTGIFRRVSGSDGLVVNQMMPNQDRSKSYGGISLARLTWKLKKSTILLINYGCHPTEYGSESFISSAFPGMLRKQLGDSLSATGVMFFQGCAGDHKAGIDDGQNLRWITSFSESDVMMAQVSKAIVNSFKLPMKGVNGTFATSLTHITSSLEPHPKGIDGVLAEYKDTNYRFLYDDWARVMKADSSLCTPETKFEVCHHRIGDWSLIGISGEPVSDYARWLKNNLDPNGFILGYTNGLEAYIPTDLMIKEGGYESYESHSVYLRIGPFKQGIESQVKRTILESYSRATPPDKFNRSQLPIFSDIKSKHRAFFVLSTGRSGTQTLAHLLDVAKNAKVLHHPEPNMILETLHAYQNRINVRDVFWRGRSHIISHAWESGLIHGETDHNMTPFSHKIAHDIPNSRFLVLVRDPREFIRSGMRRGYYMAGGPWDQGRLKPTPKQSTSLRWDSMSAFEKVCWLWAETYRHINKRIDTIGVHRVKIVRFEDLISGPQLAEEIFEFLELEGYTTQHAENVLSQKLNAQRGGQFPHPRDWPPEYLNTAWSYCGDIAELYGYNETYGR